MTKQKHTNTDKPLNRIASIDALRGITILLMLFVNDIGRIVAAPGWMKHMPKDISGMTFADWVFPGFLFIVGMSIPAAFNKRLQKGQSFNIIWLHNLIRATSLIIIGVLLLNKPNDKLIGLPNGGWDLLMLASVFLIWHRLPRDLKINKWFSPALRAIGIIGLTALAIVYKDQDGQWLKTQWWGILGIIGWAYLICIIIYSIVRDQKTVLLGLMMLMIFAGIAGKEGLFDSWWINGLPGPSIWGSRSSIVLAGVIIGSLLRTEQNCLRIIKTATIFGLFLAIAGWLLIPVHGIHKLGSSASWCLLSSAITCFAWIILYWLIDIKGYRKVFAPCGIVGQSPLSAYLLAYLIYSAFTVFNLPYFNLNGSILAVGLCRSIIYSIGICWIAGAASQKGFNLKL